MQNNKKKIVVIGGGNGSALVLSALKKYYQKFNISALISVTDSGGSSGRLREQLHCLPPGDILRAILALSSYNSKILREIFYKKRINNGHKLSGHNIGNLFLALTWQYSGNIMDGINALEQAVGALGHVFPISLNLVDLAVGLEDGEVLRSESLIDKPNKTNLSPIMDIWLEPEAVIFSKASEKINTADYIIIAPGSFVTSIVPCLLVQGVKESILKSNAKIIFIADNKYEINGAPIHPQISYILALLIDSLGKKPDIILFNDQVPNETKIAYYRQKKWGVLVNDCRNSEKYKIIYKDFEKKQGGISPDKLANILINFI